LLICTREQEHALLCYQCDYLPSCRGNHLVSFVRNSAGLEGMQELHRQFDAAAASWGAEHGPDSARAAEFAARIRYLRKLCRRLGRPRVLDLGCATGQVLAELSPVIDDGLGVDISGAMIERARRIAERGKLRFRADDAVRFCRSCSEHFDLVLLVGVLEHLPDQETALASARRVVGRTGRLVVISPHPWNLLFLLKSLAHLNREMPPASHLSPLRLAAVARRNGFRLTNISALPYAPWPALSPILARMPTISSLVPKNPLTGVVRGAFAAEFRHHQPNGVGK
jgi:SAM-dependent methyltransferase